MDPRFLSPLLGLLAGTFLLLGSASPAEAQGTPSPVDSPKLEAEWMLGPFHRPKEVNPVLTPDSTSTFHCPLRERPVRGEAMATFNPAATVRGDSVYVLYRAEDKTGEMKIGGHTSRLGLATSSDGLHFTRRPTPVFYPKPDDQQTHEWLVEAGPPALRTDDGIVISPPTSAP